MCPTITQNNDHHKISGSIDEITLTPLGQSIHSNRCTTIHCSSARLTSLDHISIETCSTNLRQIHDKSWQSKETREARCQLVFPSMTENKPAVQMPFIYCKFYYEIKCYLSLYLFVQIFIYLLIRVDESDLFI